MIDLSTGNRRKEVIRISRPGGTDWEGPAPS